MNTVDSIRPVTTLSRAGRVLRRRRVLPWTATASLAAVIAACSSAPPTDAARETTGSVASANTYYETDETASESFGVGDFPLADLINAFTSPGQSNIAITTGPSTAGPGTGFNVAFTLPPLVVIAAKLQSNQITFPLPKLSVSASGATATVTSLTGNVDMTTLTFSIVGSQIQASVTGSAQANMALSAGPLSVTPTVSAPTIKATLNLGWDSFDSVFFVEPQGVHVTFPGLNISGCGLAGWCSGIANGIVDANMQAIQDTVNGALAKALTDVFNAGVGYPVPSQIFRQLALTGCTAPGKAPPPPPQGSGDWWITNLSLANGLVNCSLMRQDVPGPVVLDVVPSTGAPGDTVFVNTNNVKTTGPVSISFGGVPSPFVNCESGACYAQVPNGGGTVDVTVTDSTNVTTPTSPADRFSYAPVKIASMSSIMGNPQARGGIAGGTVLQVWGTGFSPTTTQFFFGSALAPSYCEGDTTCVITSPAATAPGPVHVTALVNGVSSPMTSADVFTYGLYADLVALDPVTGPTGVVTGGKLYFDSNAGGTSVALASNNTAYLNPPPSVPIAAGATSASFAMTQLSKSGGSATITATYFGNAMSTVFNGACYGSCPLHYVWDTSSCGCVVMSGGGGSSGGGTCKTCNM